MTFSVITPSLNCCEYVLQNIESVRQQGYSPNELEHWIIDGGSKDGTIELLRREQNIHWISEPDKGLSDAVNKGIRKAKGDWIIWLNSDDSLAPYACKTFLEYVRKYPDIRVFAGNQTWLRENGDVERTVEGWDYNLGELLEMRTGMNQASTFVHREVYEAVGLLDVTNRYAMDYEWLVRAMHRYKCVPIPHVLTFYRRRPGSITAVHMVEQFKEFLRIRRRYQRPYLSRAEFYFRFYVYTDSLRRLRWLRREVRRVKRWFGKEPLHPY